MPFTSRDAHRFERGPPQGIENLLDEKRLHDGDDLFHGRSIDG